MVDTLNVGRSMKKVIIIKYVIFYMLFLLQNTTNTTFVMHNKQKVYVPTAYIHYPEFVDERLNTYNKKYDLPIDVDILCEPIDLICWWRFDLMAKYIYAKQYVKNIHSEWATQMYAQHLRVWGGLSEWDGSRSSLDEYLKHFHDTLVSIQKYGFDKTVSRIRIDTRKFPCEGAHRIIASLLYNKKVTCYVSAYKPYLNDACQATATFFREFDKYVSGGLAQKYLDNMALHYGGLKKNTRIIVIFPGVINNSAYFKRIIRTYGNSAYHKVCFFTDNGLYNLSNEITINSTQNKAHIFLFEPHEILSTQDLKQQLQQESRNNYTFYVSGDHNDSLRLARIFFVQNSINFLNKKQQILCSSLYNALKIFKQWLAEHNLDSADFCIDSNGTRALLAHQEITSLHILHYAQKIPLCANNMFIFLPNTFEKKEVGDTIFNPNNHFYYNNIKFATIADESKYVS